MTEGLRSWIIGLAGAGTLTAVAMTITPEGRVRKVVALVCGMVTLVMLIKPAIGFDYSAYAGNLARMRVDSEMLSARLQETNEKLSGLIIEEACLAYILDKGAELGIHDLTASVSAKWSEDGYWVPGAAKLTTDADKELRDKLGYIIQSELGIPPEELIWSMYHEG